MKKNISLFLLAVGALSLSGCGLYGGTQSNSSPADVNPAPAGLTVEANTVNIQNFSFTPAALTVKKGTAVTWVNNDPAVHQIKSTTFNSGEIEKGQSFSFTFNDAGTFDYSCAIHPSMLGKIIVE